MGNGTSKKGEDELKAESTSFTSRAETNAASTDISQSHNQQTTQGKLAQINEHTISLMHRSIYIVYIYLYIVLCVTQSV